MASSIKRRRRQGTCRQRIAEPNARCVCAKRMRAAQRDGDHNHETLESLTHSAMLVHHYIYILFCSLPMMGVLTLHRCERAGRERASWAEVTALKVDLRASVRSARAGCVHALCA